MAKFKSVWDERVTIHPTVSEKINTILTEIAKEREMKKSQVIEWALKESSIIQEKMREMEKKNFFI